MPRKHKSDALASAHELAADLMKAGAITKRTMRKFDALCLTPDVDITPDVIRTIRHREQVSQPILAAYLGVTSGMVSQWEQGSKRPGGPSRRMLSIAFHKGLQAIT